jgi:transcriptional regulator with XRE-family HTH domain
MPKRLPSDLQQEDAKPSAELQAIFGKSVRAQRIRAGWTQGELSKRSGIAQEELSRIENGQVNLTIRTMSRLAQVLDGDVAEMLGRISDPEKD